MADRARRGRWPRKTGGRATRRTEQSGAAANARRGVPLVTSPGPKAAGAEQVHAEAPEPATVEPPVQAGPAEGAERVVRGSIDGATLRIGVVCSRFNGQITTRLLTGARAQLNIREVPETATTIAWVPGVFELPLAAHALALGGSVDAVVCLGAAIRAGMGAHDYVAGAVANACQQVQLESGVPISFGVVATDDLQQAIELSGGRYGNRGAEAVDTAIEMASLLRVLEPDAPAGEDAAEFPTAVPGGAPSPDGALLGDEAPVRPR